MAPSPRVGTGHVHSGQAATLQPGAGRDPDPTSSAVPHRAAGVQLLGEMRGSGYRRPPALVRRADGQSITLTPLLYLTLRAIDGVRSHGQVAALVSQQFGKRADPEDIAYLVEHKLRPLGLVQRADGTDPALTRSNPLLALRLKVVATDPDLTRRLTAPFAWLFQPAVALPTVLAFAFATWWVLVEKGLASAAHQAFYEPGLLLTVWALVVVSAGFHEFGHAAACRYGGATPGAMGAGLYLVWPAFYTEVSDSYRLGRGGRLRVDIGGLYFNALFALATLGVWYVSRVDALLLVVAAQHLQMVRQLAPFIRADGYHIVADLTGVPDLFAHIKPTLLGVLPRRLGGRRDSALKPWARLVVAGWVLLVVPLLLGLLALAVYLLPRIAATAWDSMRLQWRSATDYWALGDPSGVVVGVLSAGIVALPVLGLLYLLTRVFRRLVAKVWGATEDRPAVRAVAALAGVALLGLVAWSWWPDGDYRPIEADDGGRITQVVDTVGGPLVLPTGEEQDAARPAPAAPVSLPMALATGAVEPGDLPDTMPTFYVVQGGAAASTLPPEAPAGPVVIADVPGDRDWVFPFPTPPPSEPGDNRALVVNTDDGAVRTALAVAWSILSDGSDVQQRNEAWALASCDGCTTVSVAFQALLVVGQADVITPVNTAAAANYACTDCRTLAMASQLVVSLTGMPSDAAQQQVAEAIGRLQAIEPLLDQLTADQIYASLTATKQEILTILEEDGAIPEAVLSSVAESLDEVATDAPATASSETTATAEPSAGTTPAPDASTADAEPGADASSDTGTEPTAPTAGTTSEPATEPTDGSSTGPTDGPTSEPTTGPDDGSTDSSTGSTTEPEPSPSPTGATEP